MFWKCHWHLGEFLYLWTGLDFDTTTEACLAEQTRKLSSFQVQIYYQPLQLIFRNSPEMHTTSLPTTAINLQKLPKDAHKSPPKTVLGNFKGFSPITTWDKFAQGVHCKLSLRLDLTHTSALCYSLNLNMWLNVSASNINQNAICNEAGTLHLFRWKRKMSQPSCSSLLLYIWSITCIHSTWQNVMKLKFENSLWLLSWSLSLLWQSL